MPPSALISSHASVSPFLNSTPSAAAKSVSGAACPTGMAAPAARAPSLMPASTAAPPVSAAAPVRKDRRLGMTFGFLISDRDMTSSSTLALRQIFDLLRRSRDRLGLMRLQGLLSPVRHQRRPKVFDRRAHAGHFLKHGEAAIRHVTLGITALVHHHEFAAA